MSASIGFRVYGSPAPQGSKRHVGNGVMVESSKKVKPWRQDVVQAAVDAITNADGFQKFTGPVSVHIAFYFPRPKYHYGTGKNANVLKPSAPDFQTTNPDLDKCVRSTFDALTTSGIWKDDNLAAHISAYKKFHDQPGADIRLTPMRETA